MRHWFSMLTLAATLTAPAISARAQRWSADRALAWENDHGWLTGANYIPRTAINQLEMWQADTFDAPTIDRELGFGESVGMNVVRVFLHNIAWEQDAAGSSSATTWAPSTGVS